MAANVSSFENAPFSEMLSNGESSPSFRYGPELSALPTAESWICASGVYLANKDGRLHTMYVNTNGFDQQPDDVAEGWLDFHRPNIERRHRHQPDSRVDNLISRCFGLVAEEIYPKGTLVGGALANRDPTTGRLRFGLFSNARFLDLAPITAAAINGEVPSEQNQGFTRLQRRALEVVPANPPGKAQTRLEFAQQVAVHSVVIRMFSKAQLIEDLGRVEEPAAEVAEAASHDNVVPFRAAVAA